MAGANNDKGCGAALAQNQRYRRRSHLGPPQELAQRLSLGQHRRLVSNKVPSYIASFYLITSWYTRRCRVNELKKNVCCTCTPSSPVATCYQSLLSVIARRHTLLPVVTHSHPSSPVITRCHLLSPVANRFYPVRIECFSLIQNTIYFASFWRNVDFGGLSWWQRRRLHTALVSWRCRVGVTGSSECGFPSNQPAMLNAVKYSETKTKSMELDTNAFLLNLAEFNRIWGGGGLIFYMKTSR